MANIPCMAWAKAKLTRYLSGVTALCKSCTHGMDCRVIELGMAICFAFSIPNAARSGRYGARIVMGHGAPLKIPVSVVLWVAVNVIYHRVVVWVLDKCRGNNSMHQQRFFLPAAISQINTQMAARFHFVLAQKNTATLCSAAVIPDSNGLCGTEYPACIADRISALKTNNIFPNFHSISPVRNSGYVTT